MSNTTTNTAVATDAGVDHLHSEEFTATADQPTLGHGHGPTPHEYVLHALDALIAASTKRSAVFDILTAPVQTVVRPKD